MYGLSPHMHLSLMVTRLRGLVGTRWSVLVLPTIAGPSWSVRKMIQMDLQDLSASLPVSLPLLASVVLQK